MQQPRGIEERKSQKHQPALFLSLLAIPTSAPNFLRTAFSSASVTIGILQYFNANKWTHYTVIYSDDDDGRSVFDTIILNPGAGSTISSYSIPANISYATTWVNQALDFIESSDQRIVLLHCLPVVCNLVLRSAYVRGLLAPVKFDFKKAEYVQFPIKL